MERTVKINIGDISYDGHGRTETIRVVIKGFEWEYDKDVITLMGGSGIINNKTLGYGLC